MQGESKSSTVPGKLDWSVLQDRTWKPNSPDREIPMFRQYHRWAGQTFFCLASGPSMTTADALAVQGKGRVITVNNTWQLAPWADIHYSSDHDWWDHNLPEMRGRCEGEFWTGYPFPDWKRPKDVHMCPYEKRARGIITTPGHIAWGGNSGYCAIGLAVQFGAARIVLLGYDQQDPEGKGHWHGQHPDTIRKGFNWPMWHERFAEAADDLKRLGIEVINCSRETALTSFRRARLEDVLCSLF